MRGLVHSLSGAALALALTAPALAQTAGDSLTLKDASRAPAHVIIDSAYWQCASGACTASGGASQAPLRACRRVVAQLGAVTAFTWQGQSLSSDQLAACNTAAKA